MQNLDLEDLGEIATVLVDLDGTLHPGDVVKESLLYLFFNHPIRFLYVLWLSAIDQNMAKINIERALQRPVVELKLRDEVVRQLRRIKERFPHINIVLSTGAPEGLVDVDGLKSLELFNTYKFSTVKDRNVGVDKLRGVNTNSTFYIGNSVEDVPIFNQVAKGAVVGPLAGKVGSLATKKLIILEPIQDRNILANVIKQIRLKHWVKNFLVFTPLVFFTPSNLEFYKLALGFLLFGFISSLIYIYNDCMDLNSDRDHPKKSNRPMAAGLLSLPFVAVLSLALMIGSALCANQFVENSATSLFLVVMYIFVNLAYTFRLKHIAYVNILIMPCFYIIRILFGFSLLNLEPSFLLIVFLFFALIPLAAMKRINEILLKLNPKIKTLVRGYTEKDISRIKFFAVSSSSITLLLNIIFWNEVFIDFSYENISIVIITTGSLVVAYSRLFYDSEKSDDTLELAFKKTILLSAIVYSICFWFGINK